MGRMQNLVRLIAAAVMIVLISAGCAPRAEEQETEEPEPTATETEEPTETPEPTETDTPEPTETDTPEPTETDTPEPTETATVASSSGSGSGSGGSQATNPPPAATSGSGQPAATSVPPTLIPPTFTPIPAATQAPPPDTSGLGTFYLRSQTVNSATCAMSVWGNGIEFVVDAPATVPLQSGVYGWQAFLGIGQTSPAEMFLPPGGVCSFVCFDEYIEWFCQ